MFRIKASRWCQAHPKLRSLSVESQWSCGRDSLRLVSSCWHTCTGSAPTSYPLFASPGRRDSLTWNITSEFFISIYLSFGGSGNTGTRWHIKINKHARMIGLAFLIYTLVNQKLFYESSGSTKDGVQSLYLSAFGKYALVD
jgi:hypothetical protein